MRGMNLVQAIMAAAVSVALLANPAGAQDSKPAKTAAIVNGVTISMREVDALILARGPLAKDVTPEQKKQLKQIALDKLIDDVLLQQFLEKYAPRLSPEERDKRLAEMEAALKKEGKTLADLSKETGQTEAQMKRNATNGLLLEGYIKGRVKEAELQRYYAENKDFFDGVLVRASHIVLRLPATASDGDRMVAKEKLLKIRQDILAKKISFSEAAKKYSESETAQRGGDLGFFPRKGAVEEPFARAAYALEINQISNVVVTDYGFHLIQVVERKAGKPSDYEMIKDAVREFYVEEMVQDLLTEQRKKSKIAIYLS